MIHITCLEQSLLYKYYYIIIAINEELEAWTYFLDLLETR